MVRANLPLRRSALIGSALLALAPVAAHATEAEPYETPRDRGSYDRALTCLTQAIYYEARSESDDGQRAVAQVVLNRVRHPSYPNSVCGVVFQGSERRTGCQFTFTCDGSMAGTIQPEAWARASRIANAALRGYVYRPVGLALNYHTTAIRPYWAPSLVRQAVIGAHIFYRHPSSGDASAFSQAPAGIEPRSGAIAASYATSRAPRQIPAARATYAMSTDAIQTVRVERPTMERVTYQRGVSTGNARPGRATVSAAPTRATPQAQPAPRGRGPRTSVESGVRVSRGS